MEGDPPGDTGGLEGPSEPSEPKDPEAPATPFDPLRRCPFCGATEGVRKRGKECGAQRWKCCQCTREWRTRASVDGVGDATLIVPRSRHRPSASGFPRPTTAAWESGEAAVGSSSLAHPSSAQSLYGEGCAFCRCRQVHRKGRDEQGVQRVRCVRCRKGFRVDAQGHVVSPNALVAPTPEEGRSVPPQQKKRKKKTNQEAETEADEATTKDTPSNSVRLRLRGSAALKAAAAPTALPVLPTPPGRSSTARSKPHECTATLDEATSDIAAASASEALEIDVDKTNHSGSGSLPPSAPVRSPRCRLLTAGRVCVHCGTSGGVHRKGIEKGLQRWRCLACLGEWRTQVSYLPSLPVEVSASVNRMAGRKRRKTRKTQMTAVDSPLLTESGKALDETNKEVFGTHVEGRDHLVPIPSPVTVTFRSSYQGQDGRLRVPIQEHQIENTGNDLFLVIARNDYPVCVPEMDSSNDSLVPWLATPLDTIRDRIVTQGRDWRVLLRECEDGEGLSVDISVRCLSCDVPGDLRLAKFQLFSLELGTLATCAHHARSIIGKIIEHGSNDSTDDVSISCGVEARPTCISLRFVCEKPGCRMAWWRRRDPRFTLICQAVSTSRNKERTLQFPLPVAAVPPLHPSGSPPSSPLSADPPSHSNLNISPAQWAPPDDLVWGSQTIPPSLDEELRRLQQFYRVVTGAVREMHATGSDPCPSALNHKKKEGEKKEEEEEKKKKEEEEKEKEKEKEDPPVCADDSVCVG